MDTKDRMRIMRSARYRAERMTKDIDHTMIAALRNATMLSASATHHQLQIAADHIADLAHLIQQTINRIK